MDEYLIALEVKSYSSRFLLEDLAEWLIVLDLLTHLHPNLTILLRG